MLAGTERLKIGVVVFSVDKIKAGNETVDKIFSSNFALAKSLILIATLCLLLSGCMTTDRAQTILREQPRYMYDNVGKFEMTYNPLYFGYVNPKDHEFRILNLVAWPINFNRNIHHFVHTAEVFSTQRGTKQQVDAVNNFVNGRYRRVGNEQSISDVSL